MLTNEIDTPEYLYTVLLASYSNNLYLSKKDTANSDVVRFSSLFMF